MMSLNDIKGAHMRILVTGASGWIGSASVVELISAGHQVLGLARNDEAAAKIRKLGAEAVKGSLDDVASLRAAAGRAEGVVHLGYNHDFSQMADAARTDLRPSTPSPMSSTAPAARC